jgi:hypothetical protein
MSSFLVPGVRFWWLRYFLSFLILFLFFAQAQFSTDSLPFTGDEPRYVYYAASFSLGNFYTPLEDLKTWSVKTGTPWSGSISLGEFDWKSISLSNKKQYAGHSIIPSMLMFPVVGKYGVTGGRIFIASCISILFVSLFLIFSKYEKIGISFFSVSLIMFSMPFCAQFVLANADSFLAACCAMILLFLHKQRISFWNTVLCEFIICLFPFLHIRSIIIAFFLFVCLLLKLINQRRRGDLDVFQSRSRVVIFFVTPLVMGLAFLVYQRIFFGGVSSSASMLSPVFTPSYLFRRFVMVMLHYKEGLLTFNPFLLFSFVGLLYGFFKKDIYSICYLLGALCYSSLVMMTSNFESIPARYMTILGPFLVYGFILFFKEGIPKASIPLVLFFLGITVVNVIAFHVYSGGVYFFNRNFNYVYSLIHLEYPYLKLVRIFLDDTVLGYSGDGELSVLPQSALYPFLFFLSIVVYFVARHIVNWKKGVLLLDSSIVAVFALASLAVLSSPISNKSYTIHRFPHAKTNVIEFDNPEAFNYMMFLDPKGRPLYSLDKKNIELSFFYKSGTNEMVKTPFHLYYELPPFNDVCAISVKYPDSSFLEGSNLFFSNSLAR